MADQKGQSEPIDSKLLRDLNSRATAVQDAARGIPEAMLTEYETVQRPIARASAAKRGRMMKGSQRSTSTCSVCRRT